ncbi:MAG: 16S rRNA (cytidine(1402)-2'-O)-methyltransferase [Candidatus Theseobacter exili]|nr:16S rRNA (cytidine(1402)-2'-O)-methyltransferase [Candidatus Theseobacter exili]
MKDEKKTGVLYIVGTPIGNLEDMTFRAIRMLKECDLVAAEDTRTARKLLSHFEISKSVTSYYDAVESRKAPQIIEQIKSGKNVCLISESGMPGLSDPGYRLINAAIESEVPVVPIPGPTAAVTALVISGLPLDRFCFEGFLSAKKSARRKRLKELVDEKRTMIFYESVHRIQSMLTDISEIFGDREVVLCRELTKRFEEILRGSAENILEKSAVRKIKGEIVLVVHGSNKKTVRKTEKLLI